MASNPAEKRCSGDVVRFRLALAPSLRLQTASPEKETTLAFPLAASTLTPRHACGLPDFGRRHLFLGVPGVLSAKYHCAPRETLTVLRMLS
ncbi:hypothetical protein VTK26DRAFT_1641 [Humicola hyalothermophila]